MFAGVVFSAFGVLMLLLRPRRKKEIHLILLDENSGDIYRILYYSSLKNSFFSSPYEVNTFAVDMGMNNIQREICLEFCEKNKNIKTVYPEEITEVLK